MGRAQLAHEVLHHPPHEGEDRVNHVHQACHPPHEEEDHWKLWQLDQVQVLQHRLRWQMLEFLPLDRQLQVPEVDVDGAQLSVC